MSKQQAPAASWASISSFGQKIENVESAFNEGVGGNYFDVGTHKDVYIESLKPMISKKNNPYIRITLMSDAGASINYNLFFENKEGTGFHFTYNMLAAAVIGDNPTLRMKTFGSMFRNNPEKLECLRGARLNVTIVQGKEGYTIVKDALDQHVVIDVETKAAPEGMDENTFGSYKDAKAAADSLSLQRAYNEVKNVSKPSPVHSAANEAALSEVVRVAESSPGGQAPTSSRANKPRPSI